jgi:hypothetical protein
MRVPRFVALSIAVACAGCASQAVEQASSPAPAQSVVKPQQPPPRAQPKEPVAPQPPTPPPEPVPSKGEQLFAQGVKSYEDGDYKSASNFLQAALGERLAAGEQASAHKYLAFIACASKRTPLCRDEFRKAFAADARFDLTAAEAGHPSWGPVFRRVKAEVAAKSKAKRAP